MQIKIIIEGDRWLAPQKHCAAWFNVSVQAFQRWNYEPVRTEGRSKLYDLRAIQLDRIATTSSGDGDLNLTQERARLAKEQADKTEMDNAVRREELIESDEVVRVVGGLISSARSKLLAIPAQVSAYLANKDANDIQSQLSDAISETLEELSQQTCQPMEAAEKVEG